MKGTGLSALTASRFFPTAELIVATVHRPLYIAELSVAILRANTERKEQVRLIHRPFQDLAIVDPDGEDINNLTGKVDIVSLDHELFDPGLIGKGVLAKINHVKKRLATVDHVMMPMGAIVSCAPCEFLCPAETGPDGFDWSAVDDCRWGAFYDVTNLDSNGIHEPWRCDLSCVLNTLNPVSHHPESIMEALCRVCETVGLFLLVAVSGDVDVLFQLTFHPERSPETETDPVYA